MSDSIQIICLIHTQNTVQIGSEDLDRFEKFTGMPNINEIHCDLHACSVIIVAE